LATRAVFVKHEHMSESAGDAVQVALALAALLAVVYLLYQLVTATVVIP
jgi:hypothetical protein